MFQGEYKNNVSNLVLNPNQNFFEDKKVIFRPKISFDYEVDTEENAKVGMKRAESYDLFKDNVKNG